MGPCEDVIRGLPESHARAELLEAEFWVNKIKGMGEFNSILEHLGIATMWLKRNRFPEPRTTPEYIHEMQRACVAMRYILEQAIKRLEDASDPHIEFIFLDRMILKTMTAYDNHTIAAANDAMVKDAKNGTEIYVNCIAALLKLLDKTPTGPSDTNQSAPSILRKPDLTPISVYDCPPTPKRKMIYELVAKYGVELYEKTWYELANDIDIACNDIDLSGGVPHDYDFPENTIPEISPSELPDNLDADFLVNNKYPSWAFDAYENKINHILCPFHTSEIPEECKVWLAKSTTVSDLISVPDRMTGALYNLCRVGDGIYVLFIDKTDFSADREHYIIHGMELVDDSGPVPVSRRKLRLLVPVTKVYRYAETEL